MSRVIPSYTREFYEELSPGSQESAKIVVPILIGLLQPTSVVDIGCGKGVWTAEFMSHGIAATGVDLEQARSSGLLIPDGSFLPADLASCSLAGRIPGLGGTFSLCVSLEVAEHLPPECADGFVRLLTRHGDVVLFSAAIPNQTGTSHINEQWITYWTSRFRKNGYSHCDVMRRLTWGDDRIEFWYRQNMMLFFRDRRVAARTEARAQEIFGLPGDEFLSRVHPESYLRCIDHFTSIGYLRGQLWRLPWGTLLRDLFRRLRNRLARPFVRAGSTDSPRGGGGIS